MKLEIELYFNFRYFMYSLQFHLTLISITFSIVRIFVSFFDTETIA